MSATRGSPRRGIGPRAALAFGALVLSCAAATVAPAVRGVAPTAAPSGTSAAPSTTPGSPAEPPLARSAPATLGAGCPAAASPLETHRGQASYYSDALAGRSTASGERYDPRALTAAHRSLPFGSLVRVTTVSGRRSVCVRINDRGPFGDRHRIVDLSRAAAEELGILRAGVAEVELEVLERGAR